MHPKKDRKEVPGICYVTEKGATKKKKGTSYTYFVRTYVDML